MVNVTIENGMIHVKSDYNAAFVKKARSLQGKWVAPYWVFPEENEEYVRQALMDAYGEDGRPTKKVKVDIDLDVYEEGDKGIIYLDNLLLVSRRSRDRDVDFAKNVLVIKGGFPSSGGSAKNPKAYADPGTVLRVTVPEAIYKKVKDMAGISLVEESDSKKKLLEEREALLKRIEEINELLKK